MPVSVEDKARHILLKPGKTVTIRGAMVNGVPRTGTAFIQEKFPGKTP